MTNESPDLRVVPVNDRVNAHEIRPSAIGRIEMGQIGPVRVSAPGSDEDGLDGRVEGEVVFEA